MFRVFSDVKRMSNRATPNPQQDSTMDEILASIRKLISEDPPPQEPAKRLQMASLPQAQLIPDQAKPRVVVPVPAAAPIPTVTPTSVVDLNVLDLTDELNDEDSAQVVRVAPATAAPAIEDNLIFQPVEAPAKMREELSTDDDLISDNTRDAMGRAFANIDGRAPHVALQGGNIESIFAEAVQQAFRPALTEWIDGHSNDVMDQLRPLIRAWMDEHLPPLIESAVVKEIARAAQRARKP
jgi:uncharacterized protein